uniref:Uncharacterized protein n=1 Tax=Picea glauca TaxID=3330 RepID=A0A101M3M8_PICGL|nr:hypothetical protein ABT39_MTgene304 [Picea glauca]
MLNGRKERVGFSRIGKRNRSRKYWIPARVGLIPLLSMGTERVNKMTCPGLSGNSVCYPDLL